MKLIISSLTALLFSGALLSAQMPGMVTMQQSSASQGTTLGANTTSGAAGIALGNRAVMRGYVDFMYSNQDVQSLGHDKRFSTTADVDFLLDFSPVTGEVHLALDPNPSTVGKEVTLEQAFGRYAFNRDFNISFGRQLTVLGFDADESPELYTVSPSYGFRQLAGSILSTKFSNNYVDGVRANFNNGKFGVTLGLHNGYWISNDLNDGEIAVDIAASLMIIPGLEARLGYAHESSSDPLNIKNDIKQFNGWIAFKPGNFTLALEFDTFDVYAEELWDVMLLANYQFTNWFASTLRYSHEDLESGAFNFEYDRFSLALLFSVTENFGINVEYSSISGDADVDEFYVEGLLTF